MPLAGSRWPTPSRLLPLVLGGVGVLLSLSGCDRTVSVSGRVLDLAGEPLPGVAVTVVGRGYQAITDANGAYTIRLEPGDFRLDIIKTGYTPGLLDFPATAPGQHRAVDAVLWRLPQGSGTFLFSDFRYTPMVAAQPDRFEDDDGARVFGIRAQRTIPRVPDAPYRLLCYRLPFYDLVLDRVESRTLRVLEGGAALFDVEALAAVENVPVLLAPVDEPGRALLELQPTRPLGPGIYAIHWGGLEGFTSTYERVYLFEVPDLALEGEGEGEAEGENAQGVAEETA